MCVRARALQVETGDAQADGDAVRALCVMQPLEMDGAEHVRICLSVSVNETPF